MLSSTSFGAEPTVLTTFRFDHVEPHHWVENMAIDAGDLDHDGHIDLFGFFENQDHTVVQIWYGPLYQAPEPTDTGTTTEPTADTGAHVDDAAPADTPTDAPKPRPAPTESGCGCASTPVNSSLSLFTRRRAR